MIQQGCRQPSFPPPFGGISRDPSCRWKGGVGRTAGPAVASYCLGLLHTKWDIPGQCMHTHACLPKLARAELGRLADQARTGKDARTVGRGCVRFLPSRSWFAGCHAAELPRRAGGIWSSCHRFWCSCRLLPARSLLSFFSFLSGPTGTDALPPGPSQTTGLTKALPRAGGSATPCP